MRVLGSVGRRAAAGVVIVVGALLASGTGLAHTDIDFTLPTDGAAVGEPVGEITVGFSDPVTLVGPGFEVLDPQGNVLVPFVATDDDTVFRLQLDPPIGGGEAAVRYEVRAEDGHTISGGFSFTISVEAPTTTASTTSTVPTVPPTTPPTSADVTTTIETTPATTTTAETTTSAVVDAVTTSIGASEERDDTGSSTSLLLAVIGAVVVAAGAFLLLRSRSMRAG